MRRLFLLLLSLTGAVAALAQPTNDECNTAIPLGTVTNYCSGPGAFTNVGATPSLFGAANCFGSVQKDVWFTFVPQATDVAITVRGATSQGAGGTLQDPQVALYIGSCSGTISELECQSATGNANIVDAYQGGLLVGSTYLIRIQGAAGQSGTFEVCINNYNPPQEPTSDCPDASILCDKSSFVVQSVTGAGFNNLEMEDATCFDNGALGLNEMNSTWFVWECSQSGSLTFTLSPLNAPDDLDFVLYRLPNGIGNCNNKQIVRCMASGSANFPSPCMGPTGLRNGDPDVSEDAGCQEAGDDAWLAPFQMTQGETYALAINNFTSTGNGFSIEFGGSGQFRGPEADFQTVPQAVCLGTPVEITSTSSFPLGQITNINWSFGAGSMPLTATGNGPHTVTFNAPGNRPIVMTVETNLGCKVTQIKNVLVYPDVTIDTIIAAPDCNGTANGSVEIRNITSGTPPYMFSWNGAPATNSPRIDNLGPGVYTLQITDANNCKTDLSIDVKERVLTANTVVDKPLCFGDSNGKITLNVTNGKPPVQFDWGSGFINNNMQSGFSAGVYTIEAIDNVQCKGTFTVTVADNPALALSLGVDEITCFGADDGQALANIAGGVGNYTYEWSDGQTSQQATGLEPGMYTVTVSDGNDCTITASANYIEPPDVAVALVDVLDLLCNGIPEGEVRVEGSGGRPPYTFSADGVIYVPTDTLTGLPAGDYWIKIQDSAGCLDSVAASLTQPPPIIVAVEPADTTVDLGFPVQITGFTLPAGRPLDFLWTPPLGVSNVTVLEPEIQAIETQAYIIQATDEDGCMGYDTVFIRVKKDRPVYFPNAIMPERPGFNNAFTGFAGPAAQPGGSITLLRIYDRWGSLIYEGKNLPLGDLQAGWDGTSRGKPVDGVFAWYAFVRFIDGVELQYEGDVTVLR